MLPKSIVCDEQSLTLLVIITVSCEAVHERGNCTAISGIRRLRKRTRVHQHGWAVRSQRVSSSDNGRGPGLSGGTQCDEEQWRVWRIRYSAPGSNLSPCSLRNHDLRLASCHAYNVRILYTLLPQRYCVPSLICTCFSWFRLIPRNYVHVPPPDTFLMAFAPQICTVFSAA